MPTTFDFGFRNALSEFHGGARLHILLAMMLHANVRNRCWPSMRGLAKETGYALAAVNDAKNWLEEHGAIEIVKYEQRIGEEKTPKINHLVNVYQLTGVIKFGDKTYPVLYVPQNETSENETSRNETLICDTEVVTSVKSVQKKEDNTKKNIKEIASAPADAQAPIEAEGYQSLPTGTKQKSARAEKAETRLQQTPATTPLTPVAPAPSPQAPRADTPAGLLAAALNQRIANGDGSIFGANAKKLNSAGIDCREFEAYVLYWREKSKKTGNWEVNVKSLLGTGRMSEYITFRAGHSNYEKWLTQVVPMVLAKQSAAALPPAPLVPENWTQEDIDRNDEAARAMAEYIKSIEEKAK